MKILLLCWRDMGHPQGGGSERYLERVGEYLAAQGHEIIFRTAHYEGAPTHSTHNGIRYIRQGNRFTVYPRALMALGLEALISKTRPDLIIDTQNGVPFFSPMVNYRGIPVILLTHHCHKEQWPVAGPGLAQLGWFLESKIAPRAYRKSTYVTVSQASAQELYDQGIDPDRVHIIHNGVDPVPQDLPVLPKTHDFHLVTLSRLVPHKQIEDAIRVVGALNQSFDICLDVIGSGWWADQLQDFAATHAPGRVHFHGHVGEELKYALLGRADLHLMPSRKEGWGLAVIEAGRMGVPTIGYRASAGLRDSIRDGETGLLVDSQQQLTAATKNLLADSEYRERLGLAAKEFAASYSWEKTGEEWAELISVICGPKL
ncbi:MAG: glycosyltransferase family 4 protein [Corynebacterium sp.]|nr:glycosyltransferase family 4 protein [Corynebacterium sp.]